MEHKSILNRHTQNYWIIGILSLILTVFLPMAGSTTDLGWSFPTTVAAWIVYVVLKLAATGLNMMIFHHFVLQAKVNVANNPSFLEAEALLRNFNPTKNPQSPEEFFGQQYRRKGITLAITTLLSTVCITQAVLTFDYVSFIVHILAVVFAIIFGIQTMREDEEWWCKDYLIYAKWYVKQNKIEQEVVPENETTENEPVASNQDETAPALHEGDDTCLSVG